ncbi:MAG TPA: Arc family DNA-binding protein [Chitinophagaceae bacterium]
MSSKKSFVLRIDEEVYKALEKWAADEFRSVNGQIEWILHQHLKSAGRLKDSKPVDAKGKSKS